MVIDNHDIVRIALYHGYELRGSGSNEYVRYLSRALARRGHEVHILCREPQLERVAHVVRAYRWDRNGRAYEVFRRDVSHAGACIAHQLPHASVRPVYLTDKQRPGNVKLFQALTDEQLDEYHRVSVDAVRAFLERCPVDVLHANHVVYQPIVAAEACAPSGTPYVIFPHGSSIEYTLRGDPRMRARARSGLARAHAIVTGNREVRDRLLDLYPDLARELTTRTRIVGVGVDTALFRPVARDRRPAHIAALSERGPFTGKRADDRARLRERLARGDRDALTDGAALYEHRQPDADLAEQLAAIDWSRDRVLLFVGALTAGKGLQGLLVALPLVFAKHARVRLLIVGSGAYREVLEGLVYALDRGDRELLYALAARGHSLDRDDRLSESWDDVLHYLNTDHSERELRVGVGRIGERVHFLGRLDHELLHYLFGCVDLAVFPSVFPEAYPLVLMESLAAGVLPAVTDFSGFHDALDELEALIGARWVDRMRLPLGPAGRIAGIAKKLDSLLTDDGLGDLSDTLRRIAERRYDWQVRAREMEDVYRHVVDVAAAL